MKKFIHSLYRAVPVVIAVMVMALCFPSCSDDADIVDERSEYDILGIWQAKEDQILDFVNPDKMYDYSLMSYDDPDAGIHLKSWIRRKNMYFFEPYSYLMLLTDNEGKLQLYKVVSVDESEMVLCWVAEPDLSGVEDGDPLQIFSIFFKEDYEVDPDKCVTYHRIVGEENFEKALMGYEVIKLDETTPDD